jgi:ethanolamine utilization protein EutQ (cupin superfamily)
MTDIAVTKPSYSAEQDARFGPAMIEHRTAGALSELGTYFMVFDEDSFSDPWQLQYEETIFVIEGQIRLVQHVDGETRTQLGDAGELLVLPRGATVQYGAEVGTRVLLSISPVDWRNRT